MRSSYSQNSEGSNPYRPFLNYTAALSLEINGKLRVDRVQMALNEIAGVELEDYHERDNNSVRNSISTTIDFESDRMSLAEIKRFFDEYYNKTGTDITNRDVVLLSRPVVKDKFTGQDTVMRGTQLGARVGMEVPKTPSVDPDKLKADVVGVEGTNVVVDDLGEKGKYMVTKPDASPFTISFGSNVGTAYDNMVEDLGLTPRNIMFVGQVMGGMLNP